MAKAFIVNPEAEHMDLHVEFEMTIQGIKSISSILSDCQTPHDDRELFQNAFFVVYQMAGSLEQLHEAMGEIERKGVEHG